jgi:hypothetical protein
MTDIVERFMTELRSRSKNEQIVRPHHVSLAQEAFQALQAQIKTLTREKSALEAERDCARHMADKHYAMWTDEKARAEAAEAQVKVLREDYIVAIPAVSVPNDKSDEWQTGFGHGVNAMINALGRSYLDKHAPAATSEDK